MKLNNSFIGIIICTLSAIFYCYEYILRITPTVMITELMYIFHSNATNIGLLSAFFYFAYTPMQIVVGILVDIYGPRRILTLSVATCAFGNYLFGIANIFWLAAIGRTMIGIGSSFAFVCMLKLAYSWLPKKFFALFTGLATMLGMVGAIFQITVFGKLVHIIGCRDTININTIIGIILIPLFWLIIRDRPQQKKLDDEKTYSISYNEVLNGFFKIIKNHQIWINGLIACSMYLSLSLFAELWGIPFLINVYKLEQTSAGISCSMVYLGWLVGSPLIGYISDVFNCRKIPIIYGTLIGMILITIIICYPYIEVTKLNMLLFLFGFFTSSEILCFAISNEISEKNLVATSSAFTNFLIMIGGIITQPFVGRILDLTWDGKYINNIKVYSVISYQIALMILPISLLFGLIATIWLKETGLKSNK